MAVRAKVICNGVNGGQVTFTTVYEPDAAKDTENARFTTATPSGQITMLINNPAALDQFKSGEAYYVDFSPAPK